MFTIPLISVALLPLFQYLLLPVVAAILINVAVKMVEAHKIAHLWKTDKKNFCVMIVVVIVGIVGDPSYGLIAGILLSILIFAHHNSKGFAEIETRTATQRKRVTAQDYDNEIYFKAPFLSNTMLPLIKSETLVADTTPPTGDDCTFIDPMDVLIKGDILIYKIPSELTFLNGSAHTLRASKIERNYRAVIMDLRFIYFMDIDGCDALNGMINEFRHTTSVVVVSGVNYMIKPMLDRCSFFHDMCQKERVFEDTEKALESVDKMVMKEINELVQKKRSKTNVETPSDGILPDIEVVVVDGLTANSQI